MVLISIKPVCNVKEFIPADRLLAVVGLARHAAPKSWPTCPRKRLLDALRCLRAMSQLGNFPGMELTRRKLFLLGAAVVTTAGGAVVASPTAVQATGGDDDSSRERTSAYDHTDLQQHMSAYDQSELRANPANRLGCPLGKGV